MIIIYRLGQMIALAGLLIIATSFSHYASVCEVLDACSAEIDRQEELLTGNCGNDSVVKIVHNLTLYGRVVSKFEHLNDDWLFKRVALGLFLCLFTTMRKQESLKTPAKCNLA